MGAPDRAARKPRGTHERGSGEIARIEDAPAVKMKLLQSSLLAVTRFSCERPDHPVTASIPRENAYVVTLERLDTPSHPFWVDGRELQFAPKRRGQCAIFDLNRGLGASLHSRFDNLQVRIPRVALDAVTDDIDAPRVESVATPPGVALDDAVIRHLGAILFSAVEEPERANRLFLDHIAMALHLHLVGAYGHARPRRPLKRGGLPPAQVRRVKDMLLARLNGEVSMQELAALCGLSRSHFARAFRTSVGQPPYRWLLARRVDRARDLLLHSALSLAQIAVESGFASQSHFTTAFVRSVGVSPGAWRRSRRR